MDNIVIKKEPDDHVKELAPNIMPTNNISSIKNKQRRTEAFRKLKKEKLKIKNNEKKKQRAHTKQTGIVPVKQIPKTIENQRVHDETMVHIEDEEVLQDERIDEVASYFNRETHTKILITTREKPNKRTMKFCRELRRVIPNSHLYFRRYFQIKKIIPAAIEKEYTCVIVVNDDMKKPNGMLVTHLPNGPTAHFKLSNVRLPKEIKRVGEMTDHRPEIILNNFNTRLGHSVGRLFASMFPHDPEFLGRRVITLHNQRDYIFFRHHRYEFRNNEKVGIHEMGPRFTLKLRSLQKGTFDSKFGEYEWFHKRHEMEDNRRKFFL